MSKCPQCGSEDRRLIDKCIVYDKYYICRECGHCDFSKSKMLSKEENCKRLADIMRRLNKNEEEVAAIIKRLKSKWDWRAKDEQD